MKKLSDYIGQKIVIHFPTYKLWLRRKEINPSDELEDRYWNDLKYEMCINPFSLNNKGSWAEISFYIKQGYTILPATDFLEEEFVYGQEYEFSDYNDFRNRVTQMFGCLYPENSLSNFKFIAFDNKGCSHSWKYCRKINTERNEAITTAKELITKFDIKQEELFNN